MRVLVVSFYFPPSGGGGVQRIIKFVSHLPAFGIETHVLAPADPEWIHRDEEIAVPPGVVVHHSPYLGPRGRRPAEELYGLGGRKLLAKRVSLLPRRVLVPDENVLWTLTAVPAGLRLGRRYAFDAILTTSPPASVNLIGWLLSRWLGLPWIADLRDSLVAKEDRRVDRLLIRLKERTTLLIASVVARNAAAVVGVTPSICAEIDRLRPRGRVVVIPNGADFEEFDGLVHRPSPRFRITHTGSFFGQRSPRPFLTALAESKLDVVARFVGDFRAADRDWANGLGLGDRLEIHPFVSHRRSLEMQRDSEALLLLLPEIGQRGKDIPSGKLFEYVASQRPILAAVPPDGTAAALIREQERGIVVAPDDIGAMRAGLEDLVGRWQRSELADIVVPEATKATVSRETRARELAELVRDVVGAAASTRA